MKTLTLQLLSVPQEAEKVNHAAEMMLQDLSINGGSRSMGMELLRIAGSEMNILFYLIFYSFDSDSASAYKALKAVCLGAKITLGRCGFVTRFVDNKEVKFRIGKMKTEALWQIEKSEIVESSSASIQIRSLPVLGNINMRGVIDLMTKSRNLAVSIQILCEEATTAEKTCVRQLFSNYERLKAGIPVAGGVTVHDPLVEQAAKRWGYYCGTIGESMYTAKAIVFGSVAASGLAASRLRQAACEELGEHELPLPLQVVNRIQLINRLSDKSDITAATMLEMQKRPSSPNMSNRFSLKETAAFSSLPSGEEKSAIPVNPFSIIGEDVLVDGSLTGVDKSIHIGTTTGMEDIYLPLDALTTHMVINGASGSGKSTALFNIIEQLSIARVPVLIIDPIKTEYRTLKLHVKDMKIFTAESSFAPLRINPFEPPDGISLKEYRSHVSESFKCAFSMPDPLPALFEKALTETYRVFGWKAESKSSDPGSHPFGLCEYVHVFMEILNDSSYASDVKGTVMSGGIFRLEALIDACPMFDTIHSTPAGDLLMGTTLIELFQLADEQKALAFVLLLIRMLCFVKKRGKTKKLQNVIVLDETHSLLNIDEGSQESEHARAAEMAKKMLFNMLAELRSYGVGFILADQSPSLLGTGVENANIKLTFHLEGREAAFIGQCTGLEEKQEVLPKLRNGQAILTCSNQPDPIGIQTDDIGAKGDYERNISNGEVGELMKPYLHSKRMLYKPYSECAICGGCESGIKAAAEQFGTEMYRDRKTHIKNVQDLIQHINAIPSSLRKQGVSDTKTIFCTMLYFARTAALNKQIPVYGRNLEAVLEFAIKHNSN